MRRAYVRANPFLANRGWAVRSVDDEGVVVVSGSRHRGSDGRLNFCHAQCVQVLPLEHLRL